MNNIKQGQLADITLETPLIAAASSATATLNDLIKLNQTALGAITTKSLNLHDREGNPETNYFSEEDITVNSKGLPGPGIDGSIKLLEEFHQITNGNRKPLIVSIAGQKPAEFMEIVRHISKGINQWFEMVELNLSCPNVAGKPILGYDSDASQAITEEILREFPQLRVAIKTPPFFSLEQQEETRLAIQKHLDRFKPGYKVQFENPYTFGEEALLRAIDTYKHLQNQGLKHISATNTMNGCKLLNEYGETVINPKANGGKAGLSNRYIRPISRYNVRTIRELMGPDITITGSGGVYNGLTALQFLLEDGANNVAIGSPLCDKGPRIVEKILLEMSA